MPIGQTINKMGPQNNAVLERWSICVPVKLLLNYNNKFSPTAVQESAMKITQKTALAFHEPLKSFQNQVIVFLALLSARGLGMKLLFLFVLGCFQSVKNDMYRFFRCLKKICLYIQTIVYTCSGDSNHLDVCYWREHRLLWQSFFKSTNPWRRLALTDFEKTSNAVCSQSSFLADTDCVQGSWKVKHFA